MLTNILLHPGEVLYIPPYWIIHSEAITLSVIIDVLSLSKEQDLLMPAYHMSLPFHLINIETKEARIVSAQVSLPTCFTFFLKIRKYISVIEITVLHKQVVYFIFTILIMITFFN